MDFREKHRLAKEVDTKNMLPEDRAKFVQETLVICLKCVARPVFYVFQDKGAREGICLTCWERK